MDRPDINQRLHEARPGNLCWHEAQYNKGVRAGHGQPLYSCKHCGESDYPTYETSNDAKNPNYCNNLNAMAEVEAEFDDKQRCMYNFLIEDRCQEKDGYLELDSKSFFLSITAPAHMRAEAALQILEKGKEKDGT